MKVPFSIIKYIEVIFLRKVSLFIAMSLDGYIVGSNGDVNWLEGHGDDSENIDSYSEFIKDIATVLMGWNTYYQIAFELSPKEWIYKNLTTYVFTHRDCNSSEKIKFLNEDVCQFLKKIKSEEGKGIWICGGANLIQQLMEDNLIDEYYISIIPTILGEGIPLFNKISKERKLKLISTKKYNGIVEVIYTPRK